MAHPGRARADHEKDFIVKYSVFQAGVDSLRVEIS